MNSFTSQTREALQILFSELQRDSRVYVAEARRQDFSTNPDGVRFIGLKADILSHFSDLALIVAINLDSNANMFEIPEALFPEPIAVSIDDTKAEECVDAVYRHCLRTLSIATQPITPIVSSKAVA